MFENGHIPRYLHELLINMCRLYYYYYYYKTQTKCDKKETLLYAIFIVSVSFPHFYIKKE